MASLRPELAGGVPGARDTRARCRRILRFAARHLAGTWWWEIFLPRIGLSRLSELTRTGAYSASPGSSTGSRSASAG